MKRIIIFRFHRNIAVCLNRIKLLRKYNPGTPIYGLYGGRYTGIFFLYHFLIKNTVGRKFDGFYTIPVEEGQWKWQHMDLAINLWFKEIGYKLDFDVLHVFEWDMLYFDSLDNLYAHIPEKGIGMTALTLAKEVEKEYCWTGKEPFRAQWLKLLEHVKEKYEFTGDPYIFLGSGLSMPKDFLEKYSKLDIPELGNDEVRLPLYVKILGYQFYNTGFLEKMLLDKEGMKYFNSEVELIENELIKEELNKKNGRRAFHPYRDVWKEKL